MPYIYTISHPFTHEVVYVGCTKNIKQRVRCHVGNMSNNPLGEWVQGMINGFMLPKVDVIDTVDDGELMFFERYWIQQFQSWGFTLFNKSKVIGSPIRNYKTIVRDNGSVLHIPKKYVKKTSEQWAIERQERAERKALLKAQNAKPKKWSLANFEEGREYKIKNDLSARRSFKEMFRQYAHRFNIKCRLSETVLEDGFLLTVVLGKRIVKPHYGKTKSGAIRYVPLTNKPKVERRAKGEKFTYGFDKIKIGDTFLLPVDKFETFSICFKAYKKRHLLPIAFKFQYSEDRAYLHIEYVNEADIFKNPPMPKRIRKNGRGKISQEKKIEILNSDLSIRELALQYDISESTIYKIKNPNPHALRIRG